MGDLSIGPLGGFPTWFAAFTAFAICFRGGRDTDSLLTYVFSLLAIVIFIEGERECFPLHYIDTLKYGGFMVKTIDSQYI